MEKGDENNQKGVSNSQPEEKEKGRWEDSPCKEKEGKEKMKLIINTNKKYGLWLKKHLEKEHPKTKNKIKIRRK